MRECADIATQHDHDQVSRCTTYLQSIACSAPSTQEPDLLHWFRLTHNVRVQHRRLTLLDAVSEMELSSPLEAAAVVAPVQRKDASMTACI